MVQLVIRISVFDIFASLLGRSEAHISHFDLFDLRLVLDYKDIAKAI